jgi:hypothetical protein
MTWQTGDQGTAQAMEHVGASRRGCPVCCMGEPLMTGFTAELARNARFQAPNRGLSVGPDRNCRIFFRRGIFAILRDADEMMR